MEEAGQLNSEDLAFEVEDFIAKVSERITGTGNDQYSTGENQQFEAMPLDSLIEYMEEELRDVAAYATMLHIRMQRVKKEFDRRKSISVILGDGHSSTCGVYSVGICTCLWSKSKRWSPQK